MGVTDRSVRTYLGQLETAALITIKQRGLGRTNLYIIHRLRPEDISDRGAAAEDISGQERNGASGQERKNLPAKNTQSESDAMNQTQIPPIPPETRFQEQMDTMPSDRVAWLVRHGIVDYHSWLTTLGVPLGDTPERTWSRATSRLKK
jgi:hypothetical protein